MGAAAASYDDDWLEGGHEGRVSRSGSRLATIAPVANADHLNDPSGSRSAAGSSIHERLLAPVQRILVVEDHAKVAESLRRRLTREGFHVATTALAAQAVTLVSSEHFDVLVLDLMLPDRDGLDLLRELRAGNIGVRTLVLTARDSIKDRLRGLDGGADDYLVKPFAMPEVVARIRALLRRARERDPRRLRVADVELDLITRQASRGSRAIDLAPREFELLAYLMAHAGQVVTREMLGRDIWSNLDRGTPLPNVIDWGLGAVKMLVAMTATRTRGNS